MFLFLSLVVNLKKILNFDTISSPSNTSSNGSSDDSAESSDNTIDNDSDQYRFEEDNSISDDSNLDNNPLELRSDSETDESDVPLRFDESNELFELSRQAVEADLAVENWFVPEPDHDDHDLIEQETLEQDRQYNRLKAVRDEKILNFRNALHSDVRKDTPLVPCTVEEMAAIHDERESYEQTNLEICSAEAYNFYGSDLDD